MKPIVFLDFDDVICVNCVYGGYDVIAPDPPVDLWENLFHEPAVATLLEIIEDHGPQVVITTSWLRFLTREALETILRKTQMEPVADALHSEWEAPQDAGCDRLQAIQRWLKANHRGEPFVILDDEASGTGLRGSELDKAGCVVLCLENVGLDRGHLPKVALALSSAKVSRTAKYSKNA